MSYILEKDLINGKQGTAIVTINGQNHTLFHCRKIEAKTTFNKADIKVTGTTTIQKKPTGQTKTGTLNMYYGSPYFVDLAHEYEKTGKTLYFDLMIENNDPTTSVGARRIALYGCSLDEIPIAKLDADADALDEELGFSFTSWEKLENFHDPAQLG